MIIKLNVWRLAHTLKYFYFLFEKSSTYFLLILIKLHPIHPSIVCTCEIKWDNLRLNWSNDKSFIQSLNQKKRYERQTSSLHFWKHFFCLMHCYVLVLYSCHLSKNVHARRLTSKILKQFSKILSTFGTFVVLLQKRWRYFLSNNKSQKK